MIADVGTVMWKEWKELIALRSSTRGGWLSLLFSVGVLGIVPVLQMGPASLESPMLLAFAGWLPLMMVSSLVADSFAGERERHTLETLLASRLPDRAILLGKVGAAVSYGWGIALATLLLTLVTVNVAYSGEGPLFFSPLIGLGSAVVGLLTAGLAAGAGVLVSLRAPTVRQAAQTMRLASIVLMLVPLFGGQVLPVAWRARLLMALATVDVTNVVLVGAGVLILLDAVLLAAAMARFQRARLILD